VHLFENYFTMYSAGKSVLIALKLAGTLEKRKMTSDRCGKVDQWLTSSPLRDPNDLIPYLRHACQMRRKARVELCVLKSVL